MFCSECKKTIPQCYACGACIGPDFIEKDSYFVVDKNICGSCRENLERIGYLVLDGKYLLKTGEIVSKLPPELKDR